MVLPHTDASTSRNVLETSPTAPRQHIWRVHGWDGKDGKIVKIGRADSIELLRQLGDGSVLKAKGKEIIVEAYADGANRCKVLIQNIHLESSSSTYYDAEVIVLSKL